MQAEILKPAVALIGWSLVMWTWMYARRLPALSRAIPDVAGMVGTTGEDLRALLKGRDQWPADNYNHLMEQPTLFYAVCLILAATGTVGTWDAVLGWSYVALRVVHSLVQATVNRVVVRFAVFSLATFALAALTVRAAAAVF
jgi:hypothetical protein